MAVPEYYGAPRRDRTALSLFLGLLLLALVGWGVWALSSTDRDDPALHTESTTVTTTASEPGRDVALEAQRSTPAPRQTTTIVIPPPVQVAPTVQVQEPPTTGPNAWPTAEPTVAAAPTPEEVASLPDPAETAGAPDLARQMDPQFRDFREDLAEFQTDSTVTLDPAQQETLRTIERRLNDLEEQVNEAPATGDLAALSERLNESLDDLREEFDRLRDEVAALP